MLRPKIMNNVRVTYNRIMVTDVKPNIPVHEKYEFNHYVYFSPLLTDINIVNNTALFQVHLSSQLEGETLYYRFTTLCTFKFEEFLVGEDQYDLLKDYSQFSYIKHLDLFKEKLSNGMHDKLRHQLEIVKNDQGILNPIQTVLYLASGK